MPTWLIEFFSFFVEHFFQPANIKKSMCEFYSELENSGKRAKEGPFRDANNSYDEPSM